MNVAPQAAEIKFRRSPAAAFTVKGYYLLSVEPIFKTFRRRMYHERF